MPYEMLTAAELPLSLQKGKTQNEYVNEVKKKERMKETVCFIRKEGNKILIIVSTSEVCNVSKTNIHSSKNVST